ncbi:hypothetical protein LSAT2_013175, partial [Lamellibrachia satsuma]
EKRHALSVTFVAKVLANLLAVSFKSTDVLTLLSKMENAMVEIAMLKSTVEAQLVICGDLQSKNHNKARLMGSPVQVLVMTKASSSSHQEMKCTKVAKKPSSATGYVAAVTADVSSDGEKNTYVTAV